MNALPTAVFLDRDGTIIEDAHYISRPDQVRLIPGAAEAIARINAALVPVIVVSNQSGIGRGYFTREDYERVRVRLDALLAARGATIDATYYCPHAPDEGCECRKPGTLLFENAVRDYPHIDLARALYVGDRWRDVQPGISLGAPAVMVPGPNTPAEEIELATREARVAGSLGEVVDRYLCSN